MRVWIRPFKTLTALLMAMIILSLVLGDQGLAVVKKSPSQQHEGFLPYRSAAPFPARPQGALGGREFLQQLARLPARRREAAILSELSRGNVPDHLRSLQPVRLTMRDAFGRHVSGTIWVSSDYIAIGSNDDFVRVPMSLEGASRLAMRLGMGLPTAKVVDEIYRNAQIKLAPDTMAPREEMASIAYAIRHDDLIKRRLAAILPAGLERGESLIAGHKKDLVMTRRLEHKSDRLAIFGWHRRIGLPIQPLNISHGRRYVDYSHGVRLVSASVYVDGRFTPLDEVLGSRVYAPLVSHEGRFASYPALIEFAAKGGSRENDRKINLFAENAKSSPSE